MRFKRLVTTSAVILLGLAAGALAQTAPAVQAGTAGTAAGVPGQPALSDTVALPAWPKSAVPLTVNSQPVPANFALGAVDGINPNLLAGVTANGYARKVAVENQTVGQVLITAVAKGDRQEAISAEGLSAQFDASQTSQLFPEKKLEVKGSKAALVAALERLAEEPEEKEDDFKKDPPEDAPEKSVSDGSTNEVASDYKVPSTVTAKEEPVTATTVTTEGCTIRVDVEAGAAYVQNKTQTTTNGTVTEEGTCSDSGTTYPLKKSYLACGDEVDLTGRKAWSRYTLYYVDAGGETHTVSDCSKDEEEFYAITEDESRCGIFVDFSQSQAVPRSALVYVNRNNTVIEARGCEASTLTAAIPMTETTSGCNLRHDYAGAKSYEQSMWTYVRDGVTYIASGCADSGETYPHDTVYKGAGGEYVCQPIMNLQGGTATLQYRKAITVEGQRQYITECTPDTSSQAVFATTDGCTDMSKWTHDIGAAVSYGQERFYLQDGGSRSYLTTCQTSQATYAHSHEITGYQAHDDQLFAFPLTTVKVTAEGSTYSIVNSAVLDGAPQTPYVLDGTQTVPTSESTYEGCNGWYVTTLSEKWKRPDDTLYLKAIGEGTPAGPRNVCQTELVNQKSVATGLTYTSHGTCYACWSTGGEQGNQDCGYGNQNALSAIYRDAAKYQNTNTELGEVVSHSYSWIGTISTTGALTGTICSAGATSRPGAWLTFSFEYFSKTCPGNDYSCAGTWVTNVPTGW